MLSQISLEIGRRFFGSGRVIPDLAPVGGMKNGRLPIFLTFDDGPDENLTPVLLEQLDMIGASATFFMIGEKVAAKKALVRSVRDAGHAVGSHSWSHPSIKQVSTRDWLQDMRRGRKVIEETLGEECRLFRAPYGALNPLGILRLLRENMSVVQWSYDMLDYQQDAPQQFSDRFANADFKPGSIVLMHDNHPAAAAHLVSAVNASGTTFEFRTLDAI